MSLASVETHLYRIPPASTWSDATQDVTRLEFLVVRLTTSGGLTGDGLAYTVGAGGSAIQAMLEDDCMDLLLGVDVYQVERTWSMLRRRLQRTGAGGTDTLAIAAVDIGLWDLAGKLSGVPLHRLLGGARDEVRAYRSGIDLDQAPEELAARVGAYAADGYRAVKVKVGRPTLKEDLDRVAAARQAIGDHVELLLDANQGWTLEEAVERVTALEQFRPAWIEEPLAADDIEGHARLRSVTRTPIAVGESLYSKGQFLAYLRAGAVDILQPDVCRVGGITEWMKVAHLAEAWQRRVAPHYLFELSAQLVAAIPNGIWVEHVEGGSLHDLGLVAEATEIRHGLVGPTTRPGHGLVFDLDRLARFEVGRRKGSGDRPRSSDLAQPGGGTYCAS